MQICRSDVLVANGVMSRENYMAEKQLGWEHTHSPNRPPTHCIIPVQLPFCLLFAINLLKIIDHIKSAIHEPVVLWCFNSFAFCIGSCSPLCVLELCSQIVKYPTMHWQSFSLFFLPKQCGCILCVTDIIQSIKEHFNRLWAQIHPNQLHPYQLSSWKKDGV